MKPYPACKSQRAATWLMRQTGFTLIDVLVTVVVFSIGLLGLAVLQLNVLKFNDSAHSRAQAALFAYEILDRIRVNRADAGSYNSALKPFSDLPSPGSSVASIDRYDWYSKLDALLPGFQGAINCDANIVCTITVQWDDVRVEGSTAPKQVKLVGQL